MQTKRNVSFGRVKFYIWGMLSQLAMDQSKVQAMLGWPIPRSYSDLRDGYYRRFVKGYASIAQPLTHQLKKNAFWWSTEATKTFEQLKKGLA